MKDRKKKKELSDEHEKSGSSPFQHGSKERVHPFLKTTSNFVVYRLVLGKKNIYGAEIESFSPSVQKILGIQEPHRIESWFEALHPEDIKQVTEGTIHSTSTGEPFEQTLRVYHADKRKWLWVYYRATPEFDSEGNPTHFNGLIVDIAEFKKAEQVIQEACQDLENVIEESEEKLRRIVERTSSLFR